MIVCRKHCGYRRMHSQHCASITWLSGHATSLFMADCGCVCFPKRPLCHVQLYHISATKPANVVCELNLITPCYVCCCCHYSIYKSTYVLFWNRPCMFRCHGLSLLTSSRYRCFCWGCWRSCRVSWLAFTAVRVTLLLTSLFA